MCCYKDYKNFEKFNNIVQVILHRAIKLIQQLPKQRLREKQRQFESDGKLDRRKQDDGSPKTKDTDVRQNSGDDERSADGNDQKLESGVEDKLASDDPQSGCEQERLTEGMEKQPHSQEKAAGDVKKLEEDGTRKAEEQDEEEDEEEEEDDEDDTWTLEECDNMFLFVSKVFLMNFPLYMAYKHCVHSTLEELSQQEASALNNYCELSVS